MYRRHLDGWVKHFDFVILDLIGIALSILFVFLLYTKAFQDSQALYPPIFTNLFAVLVPSHFTCVVGLNNHKNIIRTCARIIFA